jgi:hypothetical protein
MSLHHSGKSASSIFAKNAAPIPPLTRDDSNLLTLFSATHRGTLVIARILSRWVRGAHGRLNERVHISGVEAVACGLGAINLNIQVGPSEYREDSQIGDAPHLAHSVPDLLGKIGQGFKIGSDDLDRINTLRA